MAKKPSRKQRKAEKVRAEHAEALGLPSKRPEPVPESRQRAVLAAAGRAAADDDDGEGEDGVGGSGDGRAAARGGSIWERWQRLPPPIKWGLPALVAAGLGWLIFRPPNAPRVNAQSGAVPAASSAAPVAPTSASAP